jgi:hypothetical protein
MYYYYICNRFVSDLQPSNKTDKQLNIHKTRVSTKNLNVHTRQDKKNIMGHTGPSMIQPDEDGEDFPLHKIY